MLHFIPEVNSLVWRLHSLKDMFWGAWHYLICSRCWAIPIGLERFQCYWGGQIKTVWYILTPSHCDLGLTSRMKQTISDKQHRPQMVPSMFKHQHIFLEERAESTRRLNLLKRFSAWWVSLTFPFPTFWVSKINPEIYIKLLLNRKLHRVLNYTRDLAKLLFREGEAFEPYCFG